MTELQDKAIRRIEQVYQKAEQIYNHAFARPTITFKLKGRRAGYAIYRQNLIALNNSVLHEYGDEFIRDTPGHEAAHIIARTLYPFLSSSHGYEWKRIMKTVCDQEPTRCHNFEVKTNYIYSCHCDKKIYLSTRMHNSYLSGKRSYSCKICKSILFWDKLNEKTAQPA